MTDHPPRPRLERVALPELTGAGREAAGYDRLPVRAERAEALYTDGRTYRVEILAWWRHRASGALLVRLVCPLPDQYSTTTGVYRYDGELLRPVGGWADRFDW